MDYIKGRSKNDCGKQVCKNNNCVNCSKDNDCIKGSELCLEGKCYDEDLDISCKSKEDYYDGDKSRIFNRRKGKCYSIATPFQYSCELDKVPNLSGDAIDEVLSACKNKKDGDTCSFKDNSKPPVNISTICKRDDKSKPLLCLPSLCIPNDSTTVENKKGQCLLNPPH